MTDAVPVSVTPDSGLVLKTTPPRLSRHIVTRPHLAIDSSVALRDKSTVEIIAPAGFGKTSLLAQWRRESLIQGHLVAWLTLDANDDPQRFAEGLALAMRLASGRPAFGRSIAQLIVNNEGGLQGLTAWLAEIVNLGSETLLLLDEVQSLPDATRETSLLYLLLNAPANLKIVLASRIRLNLPLADLFARGHHIQVDVDMLRFSLKETREALIHRFDKRLDESSIVRLYEKTAGWPLGLQLAIAYLEKQTYLSTAIVSLSAAQGNIEQYFLECLMSGLSAEQADFLIDLAILESFNALLAQAVTLNAQAESLINSLVEDTPIFTVSQKNAWIRMHPMAQEFLRKQVMLKPADKVRELHERAADWLAANNLLEAAARHALAAGKTQLAYQLIGDGLYQVMVRGHQIRVLYWLDHLPPEELERQPRILLGAAWALAESEHHQRASQLVDKALANSFLTEKQRLEAMVIRGTAAYFGDNIDEAVAIYSSCQYDESMQSNFLKALTTCTNATVYLYQGKPELTRHAIKLVRHLVEPHMMALRGFSDWLLGFSYLWEGRVNQAREELAESLAHTEQSLGRRSAVSVMIASAYSLAVSECGDQDQVEDILADRLDILELMSTPEAIVMGYQVAARIAITNGQRRRAIDLLDNLYALGELRQNRRYCINALLEQIRYYAQQGLCDNCSATYKRLLAFSSAQWPDKQTVLAQLMDLRLHVARAYVALSRRDWLEIIDALKDTAEIAANLRRGRETIDIKLLLALAYQRTGLDGMALAKEAMTLANLYGFKRSVADLFPKLFQTLLQDTNLTEQTHDNDNNHNRNDHHHHNAHNNEHRTGHFPARQNGLLTVKEQEVLRLLGNNLSNKHIALALGVSDETIKWHVKNLFSKLNAISRRNVVDRARMLGILSSKQG